MENPESYTTHDYGAINKHIDEELSYHQELTRLTKGRSQRRYLSSRHLCLLISIC